MREKVLKEFIEMICKDYINVLLVGVEEYEKDFPYMIAYVNFMSELKNKNIYMEINDIFTDKFMDKVYVEAARYIGR